MAFKIKLAGIGFQVNGIYEESLKKHCGDYLDTEENSDNKAESVEKIDEALCSWERRFEAF